METMEKFRAPKSTVLDRHQVDSTWLADLEAEERASLSRVVAGRTDETRFAGKIDADALARGREVAKRIKR